MYLKVPGFDSTAICPNNDKPSMWISTNPIRYVIYYEPIVLKPVRREPPRGRNREQAPRIDPMQPKQGPLVNSALTTRTGN